MRRQHRVAVNQMKMLNPLAPTPPMLLGAPPIIAAPRTEIYSKPFIRGFSARDRSRGMMVDPNLMAFQQQQEHLMNDQPDISQAGHGHGSHHHHHDTGHHHRAHHHEGTIRPTGFFSGIRRWFERSPPMEHHDYESPRHSHQGNRPSYERHHSGNGRPDFHTTPGPSRPHSSHSRHHRHHEPDPYGSHRSREHTYRGFDSADSTYQSHSGRHGGRHPQYGPVADNWGQQGMMSTNDQLFYDSQRQHPHVGGPMIHNGLHEAYEHQHPPPQYHMPQQNQGGHLRRMFGW